MITDEAIAEINEQTDEMEACSIKYNVARIVRLSSGNFALFLPWTNEEGMPLIEIGSLEDIATKIPTASGCDAYVSALRPKTRIKHATMDDPWTPSKEDKAAIVGLLADLGLVRPQPEFKRRA